MGSDSPPTPKQNPVTVVRRIAEIPELSFVWDSSPIGMAFVNCDGYLLAVNSVFASFLGYAPSELVGTHFKDITSGPDRAADIHAFQEIIDGVREEYSMAKLYKPKMGPPLPAKLTVKRSPFPDERGVVVFASILPIDAFEAAGVDPEERSQVLQQAVGELILKNWRIWIPLLLALGGVANAGKIIEMFSG